MLRRKPSKIEVKVEDKEELEEARSSMDLIEEELDRLRSPGPRPRDLSVLTLQDRHRSKRIWDLDMEPSKDSAKVSFRRVETELRKNAAPCEEIMVWYDMFTAPDLAQSVLGHYRHALDIMRPDEVEWMPYKPEVLDALPPYCRAGMAIWRASIPLICFSYVEMHQPERVQFGFRQHVPPPSNAIHPSHGYTFRNR
ncbi:hypothetical protein Vadar_028812 [Vaccinium darrowii]|uniref:Uncharacterized protein n=1 Tax=Vaccinium darrowii TaxID=229202 RepID=A0ACB7Z7B9_9ERIC|nr:hypothetical protein Vadar_028812 [Vaccinium darrowii]